MPEIRRQTSSVRKHAAIMFTDIVGYTRLMGMDEEKAVDVLSRNRTIHQSCIEKFNGKLIKEIGDGILASFSLASEAVRCAIEIQKDCIAQDIPLKIGIHEGEMNFSGSDVIGDGVNIASRLQEDAHEGSIHISAAVYSNIRNQTDIHTRLIGEKYFKNVGEPIKVYRVILPDNENDNQQIDYQKIEKIKQRLNYYLMIGVAAAIALIILILIYKPNNHKVEKEKSIAVLPFKNLSGNPDDQYLADGMMEAILNHLQRIEELSVRSRTSVEQYRDPNRNLSVIGRELNANYILEGSFQKIGNIANLTVQLINSEKDEHLWSKDYREDWSDIFLVQGEIAQKIAQELNTVISPETEKIITSIPTTNMEAYELSLRAKKYAEEYLHSFNENDFYNAIKSAQKAIKLDSATALPYATIGWAYWIKFRWENEEYLDSVFLYTNKALTLDTLLPEAYRVRGWYYTSINKLDSAIINFEKAIEIDPDNIGAYKLLGNTYMGLGEYEKVFMNWKKAFSLQHEPRPIDYSDVAVFYFLIGDLQTAEKFSKQSINLQPDWKWGLKLLIDTYYLEGNFDLCISTLREIIRLYPEDFTYQIYLAYVLALQNNPIEAKKYLEKGLSINSNEDKKMDLKIGYVLLRTGQKDLAISRLENKKTYILKRNQYNPDEIKPPDIYELAAIESLLENNKQAIKYLTKLQELTKFHNSYAQFVRKEPYFDNLKGDPAFMNLLKNIEEQQKQAVKEVRILEDQYGNLL